MIAPHNRMMFWAAGGLLPLMTLAAAFPTAAPVALAAMGGLLLWVAIDYWRSRPCTRQIAVDGPALVRLAKGRTGTIPLRLSWSGAGNRKIRMALELTGGVHTESAILEVAVSEGQPVVDVAWPVTGRRMGAYPLGRLHLEMDSPHRFWSLRQSLSVAAELRIYPNLQTEYRLLKGSAFRRLSGIHSQRQVGKGREFEQLREYLPGDGYEDIHWKATAKCGHPVTKVFQVERTQEVYVVLDASRLSSRVMPAAAGGRQPADKADGLPSLAERYVTVALGLGVAAEQQGDLFGLVAFSDRVTRFLRAGHGKTHFNSCLESLYTLQPEAVAPDFNDLFAFIATHLRRRALIVFLTSLDDPVLAESFATHVEMIRRQHVVLVNMIRPPGARPLFSDPAVGGMSDIHQALAGHQVWRRLRETQRKLQRQGVRLAAMETERLSLQVISQYLAIKQRQVL
ncbi:MAG: DUF58 domain-containing protein [Desulfobacterales bacterium]|nr:DUF58 domain-containing protein [Desulfobacterales bacterium]